MEITKLFKDKVVEDLLIKRSNFGGTDAAFARSMEINPAVFSRIQKGERDKLLPDSKWLRLGRELGINEKKRNWVMVETDVFLQMREEILFCKQYSKSKTFADESEIGKTETLKYMAKTERNCFYVDCTQCKKPNAFIKKLATVVGVSPKGKYDDMKEDTKYYLSLLDEPIVLLDEFGALNKDAKGLVQEYWNGTEGQCSWYAVGGNAYRNQLIKGVTNDKDFFPELFSRFSGNISSIVPKEKHERQDFYKKLVTDVLSANIKDKSMLNTLVKQCLIKKDGIQSGLRRAESLLILHNA